MTWPADDLTVINFASGSDPSQARAEILAAINKLKAVLAQYNIASGICPLGADSKVPSANLPALNYLPLAGGVMTGAVDEAQGADIASAATINLEAATGNVVDVTGTTTVTAITLSQGACRTVRFTGALTLTNGASLVLPSGANITTAAGDYARFRGYAGGVVRCEAYQRASGAALGGVVTSFNGRQGAVTLAYGDVTAALGSGIVGGLNADLLDGQHASAFAPASHAHGYVSQDNGASAVGNFERLCTLDGYSAYGGLPWSGSILRNEMGTAQPGTWRIVSNTTISGLTQYGTFQRIA